ncbi:uncharacterized protein [Ambystoma mexicanum]|uniref:uncharacterized protein isoform X2 n=1 Tax=Ambystoma mexicanum TaxID=8296 RepID=UPI0037E91AD0
MSSTAVLCLLSVDLFLACALGFPSTPQNVTLVSEDFYTRLTWSLDGSSTSAAYEIEIFDSTFESKYTDWTRVNVTCEVISSLWTCDLSSYFSGMHSLYWARVRAVNGGLTSNWTTSNELLHYRDVTFGPPEIALQVLGQELRVGVTTKLTPLQNERDAFQRVHEGLKNGRCVISIYEGAQKVDSSTIDPFSSEIQYASIYPLKHSSVYCTEVTLTFRDGKAAGARKCVRTPPGSPDFHRIGLILGGVFGALIIFSSPIWWCINKYVNPDGANMRVPKSLAMMTGDQKVDLSHPVPDHDLQVNSISLCLLDGHSPEGDSDTEGATPAAPQRTGEYEFWHDRGYHTNSFGSRACGYEPYLDSSISCPLDQQGLNDSLKPDQSSSSAGLLEDVYCGSNASEPPIPQRLRIHLEWSSSESQGSNGQPLYPTSAEEQTPRKAACTRHHGRMCLCDLMLDIPLNSVELQPCMKPVELQQCCEFYDTGTDESTDDSNFDSLSVVSFEEDIPPPHHHESLEDVQVSRGCYEPRTTIREAPDQSFSGYEPRSNVWPPGAAT